MLKFRNSIAILMVALLYSCSQPPKTEIQPPPPTPPRAEMKFRIAALNMAQSNKRLEQRDITQLVQQLKKEQVEIFTLQNVVRYPGIPSRLDIVEEVAKRLECRVAFSEMVNSGGKQTGNAIFSLYPILSQFTIQFDKIVPSSFDAALKATIDIGVASLTVVTAQIPPKIGKDKLVTCLKEITGTSAEETKSPLVVAGNIPSLDYIPQNTILLPVATQGSESIPRVWISSDKRLESGEVKTFQTSLGTVVFVEFEFYNSPKKH